MNLLAWAKAIKERDGYKCVECGSGFDIDAHHIVPIARGGVATMENGITLCRVCHGKAHTGDNNMWALSIALGHRLPHVSRKKMIASLDKALIDAVRKFATEDDRPISVSAAMAILLKRGLEASGVPVASDEAPKRSRKGQG